MKSKHLEIFLALALVAVVVSAFATTWTENTGLSYFGSLGMSADGRIVCAVPSTSYAIISTNWGQTWTVATNISNNHSPGVAVSADGSRILLNSDTYTNNSLLLSTNYGNTWLTLLTTNSPSYGSAQVACSADGSKLIVVDAGSIYFSTNDGADWHTSSVALSSLASSADGQLMVGAAYGGSVYFSTNFGAAWTPTNLPIQSWQAVCVSADGTSIGATGTGTGTYISTNDGINWRTINIRGNGIACSAHGINWIIGGTAIYTSNDGGVTWQTNFPGPPVNWYGSAVSADGCDFMIVGTGGIATGRNTPSPQLNIQPADQALNLSWLIPSTNFVLQQNSDLTTSNWTTVPYTPLLNFTNLQQQVSIPSSPSNSFFRLIAQ